MTSYHTIVFIIRDDRGVTDLHTALFRGPAQRRSPTYRYPAGKQASKLRSVENDLISSIYCGASSRMI